MKNAQDTTEWGRGRERENHEAESDENEEHQDVLGEVEVLHTYFFDEFSETKSSLFLKNIIDNQSTMEVILLKRAWRTVNCFPKR